MVTRGLTAVGLDDLVPAVGERGVDVAVLEVAPQDEVVVRPSVLVVVLADKQDLAVALHGELGLRATADLAEDAHDALVAERPVRSAGRCQPLQEEVREIAAGEGEATGRDDRPAVGSDGERVRTAAELGDAVVVEGRVVLEPLIALGVPHDGRVARAAVAALALEEIVEQHEDLAVGRDDQLGRVRRVEVAGEGLRIQRDEAVDAALGVVRPDAALVEQVHAPVGADPRGVAATAALLHEQDVVDVRLGLTLREDHAVRGLRSGVVVDERDPAVGQHPEREEGAGVDLHERERIDVVAIRADAEDPDAVARVRTATLPAEAIADDADHERTVRRLRDQRRRRGVDVRAQLRERRAVPAERGVEVSIRGERGGRDGERCQQREQREGGAASLHGRHPLPLS